MINNSRELQFLKELQAAIPDIEQVRASDLFKFCEKGHGVIAVAFIYDVSAVDAQHILNCYTKVAKTTS
ncbi:hypothetical protein I6H07_06240 [Hafnia alvei]|nr:hypothetical protein [Hafnia alvei]MBI0275434.1 hypothetical protein [Hafnia alvei]PNK98573.1 hypothetical protein CEQ28_013755 [Hafnia alvei]